MSWHGPEQLGGALWSNPKVVAWGGNRLDVFAIGRWPDNTTLMHQWWGGQFWGGWESLGGSYSAHLDVVSCRPDRLDVFTLGPRDHIDTPVPLWHTWWTGQCWQGPELLGGSLLGGAHPCAVSWGPSRHYDVFAVGSDHTLQHWWSDSQGAGGPDIGGPESLGGDLQFHTPKAVSWGPGRCDVFALANDRTLQHWWLTWNEWVHIGDDEYAGGTHEVHGPESLGGPLSSVPLGAVSWGPDRLDIFALDDRMIFQQKYWDGARWSSWMPLSGPTDRLIQTGGVTAVSWAANRIDLFAIGSMAGTSTPYLWHMWWNGSRWGGPESLGSWSISQPTAACWGPNRIDVFGRDWGSILYHTWWDATPSVVAPPPTPQPMPTPPPSPQPPTVDPYARVRFDFVLGSGEWQRYVTPNPNEMFVAVAPPGTDFSRALHYQMSLDILGWRASVPASVGGPGIWTFQCHIRGFDAYGNDTGDIWSPVSQWNWQILSPAAFFTLDGSGYFYPQNWNVRVLNS